MWEIRECRKGCGDRECGRLGSAGRGEEIGSVGD